MFLKNNLTSNLREVDYSCKNYKYKYLIEQPYTHFDLKFYQSFVEKAPKKFNLLMWQMSKEQLKRFVHNQFPENRKTVLHLIGRDFLAVDSLATLSKEENFVVPFLLDQD